MSALGKIAKVGAGAAAGFLGGGGVKGAIKGGIDAATGGDSTVGGVMRKMTGSGSPTMDGPGTGGISGNGGVVGKVIKRKRSPSGGRSLSSR